MSTFVYAIGYAVFIGGLAYAALLLGVPQLWIAVGAVILGGIGLVGLADTMRRKEEIEDSTSVHHYTTR